MRMKRKEWLVIVKRLDQKEDYMSKNGKIKAIMGSKAISKNRSVIGMNREVLKKKGS